MKIPPVKGTRDFYPQDMAVRNWIIDGWKKASIRNGFEEYDGPIFEYLDMYRIKSGDEIVEQLFSFTDRGGRELAIRPEITPTLARMVNQQINSLPKPIKWFSVPRLCRAERPQKGRLREFFQWNIDIIGEDSVLADVEVIYTTVDYLRQIGLTNKDIRVKISSRKLLAAVMREIGISDDTLIPLYALLDKKAKLPQDIFYELLVKQVQDNTKAGKIRDFMELDSIDKVACNNSDIQEAFEELYNTRLWFEDMGIWDFCDFDPSIVRGLAYYTGIVFEVHDAVGELRAICGGGRYDNLLRDFGGPPLTGTGMGMGDCVLEILLEQKGLLDKQIPTSALDFFVTSVPAILFDFENKHTAGKLIVIRLIAKLRSLGFSADFDYNLNSNIGKQLRQASERNAKKCIIIGDEFKAGRLVIKDMTTGKQELVEADKFFANLKTGAK